MTIAENWQIYKDEWHGITVEKPANWTVRHASGLVVISPNPDGLVGVTIRSLQLEQQTSAEIIARHFIGSMNKVLPTMSAWSLGEASKNMLVMRTQATYKQVPMEGIYSVQVSDKTAIISGFQVEAAQMEQMVPMLVRILNSFSTIKSIPLKRFTDPNEAAFFGYVPQDWQIKAVLHRTPDQYRAPLTELKACDPTGTCTLYVPPVYEQYTENPMMMMSPGPVRYMLAIAATVYIERLLVPRLRAQHLDMHIEAITRHADIAKHEIQRAFEIDAQGGGQIDVASLQYTFTRNGTLYREKIYVRLNCFKSLGSWIASILIQVGAPAKRFAEVEPIFTAIAESLQVNPQWAAREKARNGQMIQQAYGRALQAQQQHAASLQRLHSVQMNIAQDMRQHINDRYQAFMENQHDMHNILQGRVDMRDPWNGQQYNVEIGHGAYWVGDGYVYGTPGNLYAPKLGLHRLEAL